MPLKNSARTSSGWRPESFLNQPNNRHLRRKILMASSKATGASAPLGVAVDAPSDLYAVGRPGINMNQVGAPMGGDLTVTASVGDGNLTGSFCYRYAFGSPDGALTAPGAPVMTMVEGGGTPTPIVRSEEQTSELQSP